MATATMPTSVAVALRCCASGTARTSAVSVNARRELVAAAEPRPLQIASGKRNQQCHADTGVGDGDRQPPGRPTSCHAGVSHGSVRAAPFVTGDP
jgi:hypothetical protein